MTEARTWPPSDEEIARLLALGNQNVTSAMIEGIQKCAGCEIVAGWPTLQAFPELTDPPRCKYCRQDYTDWKHGIFPR